MKPKILIITTASLSLHILHQGFYKYFSNIYKMHGMAGDSKYVDKVRKQGIDVTIIEMEREISIFRDIKSFIKIGIFLARNRFDIIHYSTFKASLIGSIVSKLTFQKKTLYTNRGRVYENYSGIRLVLFEFIEKVICSLSNLVVPISKELGEELIQKQICSQSKIRFVANGSSNGINTKYFKRCNAASVKSELKKKFGLNPDKITIGFLGRVRFDKGIEDLVKAFRILCKKHSHIELLIAGPDEVASSLDKDIFDEIIENKSIFRANGYVEAKEFYQLIDIFLFPSHREGFGNVALEANSMNLPVVGTDILGIREAIEDKVTGFLFQKENVEDLVEKMELLIQSDELRMKMGVKGRIRTVNKFDNLLVWKGINKVYEELLCDK